MSTLRLVAGALAVAVAVTAGLLAVGHSTGDSSSQSTRSLATGPTSTAVAVVAPLTGLPPANANVLHRPAIDMKIDDDFNAKPQSGINQADLVYEEVVEGGITRWLAVFQSESPGRVGPVRSVRATDADLVAPIGGLFAYSGGIPAFVSDVMSTGVIDVGANSVDASEYQRDPNRASPDNLYTSTTRLWYHHRNDTSAPHPLFAYRALGAPLSASGATTISSMSIEMSGDTTVGWRWNSSSTSWDRSEGDAGPPSPSLDAEGRPISFTNVIIQYVPYHDTGFIDPAGNPVPDANTIGEGQALVLTGGDVVRATWSKPHRSSTIVYRDTMGNEIRLAPGNTWVELVPTGQPAPICSGGKGLASVLCASVTN